MENFKIEKYLGKGSFGSVVCALRIEDNRPYAIKEISLAELPHADRDAQLTEIRILTQLYHPNIIKLYEAFIQQGKLNMVIEYAPESDLEHEVKLHASRRIPFEEERIWQVLLQVLSGLRFLHSENILHRDVKTSNILCFDGGVVKIGDFGVSKILKTDTQKAYTGIGTPYYISSEIWEKSGYTHKCDVFSLGCMIYQMCELEYPFKARDMNELSRKIIKGVYQAISDKYSKDLRDLVDLMLKRDQNQRYSVEELIRTEAVERRIKLCPTGLEEKILPGLGTQKNLFGVVYNGDLGQSIKYNEKVSNAMNARFEDATLIEGQYEKLEKMDEMAKFELGRKEQEPEISDAFKKELEFVESGNVLFPEELEQMEMIDLPQRDSFAEYVKKSQSKNRPSEEERQSNAPAYRDPIKEEERIYNSQFDQNEGFELVEYPKNYPQRLPKAIVEQPSQYQRRYLGSPEAKEPKPLNSQGNGNVNEAEVMYPRNYQRRYASNNYEQEYFKGDFEEEELRKKYEELKMQNEQQMQRIAEEELDRKKAYERRNYSNMSNYYEPFADPHRFW